MSAGPERDFARCAQRWSAATNRRCFRTAQQDEADRRVTARLRRVVRRLCGAA